MQLTPEEKMVRDSYLLSRRLRRGRWMSYELALVVVSAGAFIYGFVERGGDRAMLFVGYCLALLASLRYIHSAAVYGPHMESLIAKYESEIAEEKTQMAEPGATDNPGDAQ